MIPKERKLTVLSDILTYYQSTLAKGLRRWFLWVFTVFTSCWFFSELFCPITKPLLTVKASSGVLLYTHLFPAPSLGTLLW